jgi:SAM-dependent methyltransferase
VSPGAPPVERIGQLVGEHRHHTQCRFCLRPTIVPFIDFGYVPLAGGFHKNGTPAEELRRERVYPLQICFCTSCALVQVNNAIPGDVLFRDYFYFSSAIKTLADHFKSFAQELRAQVADPAQTTLVELGCNDGVFLRPLKAAGFKVVGVDPATNVVAPLIVDGFDVVNDYFTESVAADLAETRGRADAIFSSNSFAHIDDMNDVMRGVKRLLKPDGYLAFEVHYLGTLLRELHYDMMYHEHLSYYSLTSLSTFLDRFDMEVFDVKPIPIHGGSIRFSVQNRKGGRRTVTAAVNEMRRREEAQQLDRLETYQDFGKRVERARTDLLGLLDSLKAQGKSIAGYGASGRATAMSAYCGLDRRYLDAVIDDAPAKQGAFTPGNHIQIIDSSILKSPARPDYSLLFAWAFADEIRKRNQDYIAAGGKFIVPLPQVRVLD